MELVPFENEKGKHHHIASRSRRTLATKREWSIAAALRACRSNVASGVVKRGEA